MDTTAAFYFVSLACLFFMGFGFAVDLSLGLTCGFCAVTTALLGILLELEDRR